MIPTNRIRVLCVRLLCGVALLCVFCPRCKRWCIPGHLDTALARERSLSIRVCVAPIACARRFGGACLAGSRNKSSTIEYSSGCRVRLNTSRRPPSVTVSRCCPPPSPSTYACHAVGNHISAARTCPRAPAVTAQTERQRDKPSQGKEEVGGVTSNVPRCGRTRTAVCSRGPACAAVGAPQCFLCARCGHKSGPREPPSRPLRRAPYRRSCA